MKRIVLAGGSGFLGRVLAEYFRGRAQDIVILSRAPRPSVGKIREVNWDGRSIGPWAQELEGAEALVNLTGRSVNCRYTARNRREIMDSRIESTRLLGRVINECMNPPGVWLNASTATIYRHTFGPAWDELGQIGSSTDAKDEFSIEVVQAWEKAFHESPVTRTRQVLLRTAMVLGCAENSVFPVLRRLVRFGLGGSQGQGTQFVSWIHQHDFCRAVEWLIEDASATGVYNLSAPEPVTNREMMRILRRIFHRPVGLSASSWMLELGAFFLRTETELVLKSRRVIPARLLQAGFEFSFTSFESAAADLAKRCRAGAKGEPCE